MVRPKSELLQLRAHVSGQSFVRVDGRNIYLGRTGDPLTLARYSLFIAEYQANGLVVPDGFDPKSVDARAALLLSSAPIPDEHLGDKPTTVCQLSEAYREHAQTYYANDPQMRGKIGRITKFIDEDYGSTEAAKFGPVKLESIRNRWVVAMSMLVPPQLNPNFPPHD
ncbi:MAG: hypothetical protein SGI77_18830 [Pirellulaceae bacterium]|nr:hypothetical protein [Pirellulaceae bacterium]